MLVGFSLCNLPVEVQKIIFKKAGPCAKSKIKQLDWKCYHLIENDPFFKVYDLPRVLLQERVKIAENNVLMSSKILGNVAKTLFLFEPERATQMAHTALEKTALIKNEPETLGRIVIDMASIDLERALIAARESSQKNPTLASIIGEIAPLNPEKALELSKSLDPGIFKANAFAYAAGAFVNDDPQKKVAINLALREIESLEGIIKISGFFGLVRSLVYSDPKLAFDFGVQALAIAQLDNVISISCGLVFAFLAKIDVDEMLKVATKMNLTDETRSQYVKAKSSIDPMRALEEAELIQDGASKALALTDIIEAIAVTNPKKAILLADEALQLANGIENSMKKANVLMRIAKALSLLNTDWALEITNLIDDSQRKSSALETVVVSLARSDLEKALLLAETIVEPQNRATAFMDIARALSGTGPIKAFEIASKAIEHAKSIKDPEIRDLFFQRSIPKFMF